MPENETLTHDSKTASRWQPICNRLDAGLPLVQAFSNIQIQFYASHRRVWQQWRDSGVDPAQLFSAGLNDPVRMAQLIRQTRSDGYARLLGDVSRGLKDCTPEGLIREFLDSSWEIAGAALQLDSREHSQSLEFAVMVDDMLGRISNGLIANPSRFPRLPKRKEPPPDLAAQLGESLL